MMTRTPIAPPPPPRKHPEQAYLLQDRPLIPAAHELELEFDKLNEGVQLIAQDCDRFSGDRFFSKGCQYRTRGGFGKIWSIAGKRPET